MVPRTFNPPDWIWTYHVLQLLKLEWWSEEREFLQARNADIQGFVSEAEIEDAAQFPKHLESVPSDISDEMMVDAIAREEEAELDALVSSFSQEPPSSTATAQLDSGPLSDDEDYDALFMDFVEEQDVHQENDPFGGMDMS